VIDAKNAMLDEVMTCRSTALYIAWLLGQRQQRADRLLGAISSLDTPGRLATMVPDFFKRLSRRGLVTGPTYNLPLKQAEIRAYLGAFALGARFRGHDENVRSSYGTNETGTTIGPAGA
jgi:hypothetical protein